MLNKVITFDNNSVKKSPEVFKGVILQSFLHPLPEFNDGFDADKLGYPDIRHSFGLFTILPHHQWPATKFRLTEVLYILEGKGILECNNEVFELLPGKVVYLPKNTIRIIKNDNGKELKYLSFVDPAWLPNYEEVI